MRSCRDQIGPFADPNRSYDPGMAMMIRFAVHRARRLAAVFYGGDEHAESQLPAGWEELVPRNIIKREREFDRWIKLDLDARLAHLAPPGYTCIKGMQNP